MEDNKNIIYRGSGNNIASLYVENGFVVSEGRKGVDCFKIPVRNISDIKCLSRKRVGIIILAAVCVLCVFEAVGMLFEVLFVPGARTTMALVLQSSGGFQLLVTLIVFFFGGIYGFKACMKYKSEIVVYVVCSGYPYEIKFLKEQEEDADKAYQMINEAYEKCKGLD